MFVDLNVSEDHGEEQSWKRGMIVRVSFVGARGSGLCQDETERLGNGHDQLMGGLGSRLSRSVWKSRQVSKKGIGFTPGGNAEFGGDLLWGA